MCKAMVFRVSNEYLIPGVGVQLDVPVIYSGSDVPDGHEKWTINVVVPDGSDASDIKAAIESEVRSFATEDEGDLGYFVDDAPGSVMVNVIG